MVNIYLHINHIIAVLIIRYIILVKNNALQTIVITIIIIITSSTGLLSHPLQEVRHCSHCFQCLL